MTREETDKVAPPESGTGEAVLSIFKRGEEFTKQLLLENEGLRKQLRDFVQLHQVAAQSPDQWERLRLELSDRITCLEAENQSIRGQLHEVESENHQFAERYVEIQEENNNLANLYVASYQLHSTLDAAEVLKVIVEIVINLVGAEDFAIYIHDEGTRYLEPVACEGRPLADFPRVEIGTGFVGESVASGQVVEREVTSSSAETALVSIPLLVGERPVGVIAIYGLLQQKSGFSSLDHELFTLLAGHAATAILASRIHSLSKRKLSTIQGFVDLLTR